MSGMLANLVGAATAALNLRPQEPTVRSIRPETPDAAFATALSAALAPRQRAESTAPDRLRADRELEEERASERSAESAASHSATSAGAAAAGGASAASASASTSSPADADAGVTDSAAASLEAAAAEEASGPGPARRSPTTVLRTLQGLDPEFRARLQRVIDRMEKEHGHDVTLVETVRDQSRQNYLFEQGRSRPGPVVTWTRSSNHTRGRAADVIVDGTYNNPLAMVRLARIAREEGLRTLGAKDPGHVELPSGVRLERLAVGADATTSLVDSGASRAAEAVRAATASQPQGAPGTPGVARVATVARVASVAQVAQVANVARVATPGSIGGGAALDTQAAPAPAPEQAPTAVSGQLASSGGDPSRDDGRREGRPSQREPVMEASGDATPRVAAGTLPAHEPRAAGTAGEVRGAPASFGAEAAERIARVLQLQDTTPTRPLSQVVLRVDNATGGEDRIRVDLRGSSVGASLSVSDPVAAARLQSELGQLQRALEGRGLQAEHLSVTGAPARELVEAARTPAAPDSGQRPSHDSASGREGWNGRSGGRQNDQDPEQPHQRPRRNLQQERNT